MPRILRDLEMRECLRDPERKQRYVTTVFEIAAPSYDLFTRWCSLGLDMAWKRDLLSLVKACARPNHRVLDLASGTGDLALAVARLVPHGQVLGLDVSQTMIRLAEQKGSQRGSANTRFLVGDMMALPLPASSMNGVTIGYGLRNCPDLGRALAEIHRVLKPGGYLASLEFTRPGNALWRWLFLQFLLAAGNLFGWLWHRQPAVYAYLAHSITQFRSRSELSEAMNYAGFEVKAEHPWMLDAVCIHLARKKL